MTTFILLVITLLLWFIWKQLEQIAIALNGLLQIARHRQK